MPKLTVENRGTFDVPMGARLVLAIEGNGIDILHRCGGNARCTTCRVQFIEGEPAAMTQAEKDKLTERDLLGQARLSCQIQCNQDMTLRVLQTLSESGLPDPGGAPEPHITPAPAWTTR
jgi:ferredoxin